MLTAFLIGLAVVCFTEALDHHSDEVFSRRVF